MSKFWLICSLVLLFSLKISAQEINTNISANTLMRLVVQKAEENDKLKDSHLVYMEDYRREEFDYKGTSESIETSTSKLDGTVRKLAGFELKIGGLLKILFTRHDFVFSNPREIILNNKVCLVLEFKPKNNVVDSTTESKFINRLQGKIIVDKNNYSLLQVDSEIPEKDKFNFKIWRFIFWVTVKVEEFKLNLRQIEYRNIMVENQIEVKTKFKVLSATKTRNYLYRYRDYTYR